MSSLKNLFDLQKVKVYFLGVALDCVNLKAEVLTLLIMKRADFENCFGDHVDNIKKLRREENEGEGEVIPVTFSEKKLRKYLENEKMLAAGGGCLATALRHYAPISKLVLESAGP